MSTFSLDFPAIRLAVADGARGKVIVEFRQTSRGRGLLLLGYSLFKMS